MNTYRTDKRKQHEPKPQTKLTPIPKDVQTQQYPTTQSQGTATQTGQNQRYRTTQNVRAKQTTKLERNKTKCTEQKGAKVRNKAKVVQHTDHEDNPKAHRLKHSGFYCVEIIEHGGKFHGVWGIV